MLKDNFRLNHLKSMVLVIFIIAVLPTDGQDEKKYFNNYDKSNGLIAASVKGEQIQISEKLPFNVSGEESYIQEFDITFTKLDRYGGFLWVGLGKGLRAFIQYYDGKSKLYLYHPRQGYLCRNDALDGKYKCGKAYHVKIVYGILNCQVTVSAAGKDGTKEIIFDSGELNCEPLSFSSDSVFISGQYKKGGAHTVVKHDEKNNCISFEVNIRKKHFLKGCIDNMEVKIQP